MADDIVGGLFGVNPDMYQQQQQQQVFNRAVALQNLNPFQQAAVGLQQAGYNFGGALGGAMGGVDPQLQRISALNAISKRIDQNNPESLLQGAKMLADAGFTQEALGLAQYARKANSEIALAQQRMKEGRAAATPKEVQIAEYSANIKNQLNQLQAMEQTPEVINAVNLLQSRLDALPQPKEAAQNADIVKAQRAAQIVNQLAVLKGLPEAQQNPQAIRAMETELAILNPTKEFAQNADIVKAQRAGQITSQLAVLKGLPVDQQNPDAIRALETELAVLSPTKEAPQNADIVKAQRIGELVGQIDTLKSLPEAQQNPALIKQLNAQLLSLSGGNNKISNFAQQLIDRGLQPGSKEFNDRMDSYITKETTLPEKTAKAPPSVGAEAERISLDEFGVNFYDLTQEQRKIVNQKVDAKATKADRAPPSVGTDAERISLEKFGKNYYDLNTEQRATVNIIVGAKEPSGKVTITNVLPGAEKLGDVPKFRSDVQRTIEPQLKIIDATDNALTAIDDSIKNNNFSSFRAAQTQFARAISGGGDLSQKELLAAGADPAILGGTADYLSKLVSGTPTLDTQNSIRKTLIAIRKVSVDKAQAEIKAQRSIADLQKYPPAALDAALNFPQLKPYQGGAKASKTLTTKSGKTVTVTEE